VPYAERSLEDFLGHRPDQACATATSVAMARRALERARWLAPGEAVVGAGCTASLATDRPKRGDHRFHLAVHDTRHVWTYSLTLIKDARDREGEEAVLDVVLLNALAGAFAIEPRLPVPLLGDEAVVQEVQATGGFLAGLLQGDMARVCMEVDGRLRTDGPAPKLLLPGSFNPLHEGHCRLAAVASQMTGQPPAFELSVTNVDKPPLEIEEIQRRLSRFCWQASVWLTRAPTFAEKAQLFPGVVFVVGADTAVRIVDVKYYQDDEARMAAALEHLCSQGCRFLVAGRLEQSGRFVGLDELPIPPAYRDLFVGIPEAAYRCDISSTQLRQSTIQ
jgi:hypothetical protein